VTVRCPKCKSNASATTSRHPFYFNRTETVLHCQWCGTRKYGDEAVRLVEESLLAAEKEEADRRSRKEIERAVETARVNAMRQEAKLREEERIKAQLQEAQRQAIRLAEIERLRAERLEAERQRLAELEAERLETERLRQVELEAQEAERLQQAQEAERRFQSLNTQARIAAIRRIALVNARAAAMANRDPNGPPMCASPWCANTLPVDTRSMYCCRKCKDDVARDKYDAKKHSRPKTIMAGA